MDAAVHAAAAAASDFVFSTEWVNECRYAGFSWAKIQRQSGMSVGAFKYYRKQSEFADPLRWATDQELLHYINYFVNDFPSGRGERNVKGWLTSLGLKTTRSQIRWVVSYLDPNGRARRYQEAIPRDEYFGYGPGFLWHFDTNHNVGRYGFVIFAIICGYSHEVICLDVICNKKAKTLMQFMIASPGYNERGVPANARCDFGAENYAVSRFLHHFGVNVFGGPSTSK